MLTIPGFEHIEALTLAAVAAIIFGAALVHGTLGVGFPMVATPLLALLTDVRSAMLTVLIPTLVLNVTNILRGGRWQRSIGIHWPLAAYGILGSVAGTWMLVIVDPEPFRLLMAVMIIVYLNAHRVGAGMTWVTRQPALAYLVFGTAGGLLAGTVNVMLPALIIFALEVKMEKTVMVQVFNFCFFFGKLSQGVVFAAAGALTVPVALGTLPLAAVGLIAGVAGMGIRDRIDTDTYRKWMQWLLGTIAMLLVIQFCRHMVSG